VTGSFGADVLLLVLLLDGFKAGVAVGVEVVMVVVVEMGEVGLAGETGGDVAAVWAVAGDLLSLLFFTLPNVCSMAEI